MSPFTQTFASNKHSFGIPTVWLNVTTAVLLVALCLVYIFQINHTVSKGYKIREFEAQIQELTIRNQKLEIVTQKAQSLENITRATKMMGLVSAGNPTYVQTTGASYALAE